MTIDIIMKLLFNEKDRYLIKKQKCFVLGHTGSNGSDASIDFDYEQLMNNESPYFKKLIQGTREMGELQAEQERPEIENSETLTHINIKN